MISWAFTRNAGWVRIGPHIIQYTNSPPYFSERHGYKRVVLRLFGYRVLHHRSRSGA